MQEVVPGMQSSPLTNGGRNLYGTPPQRIADYAFCQHILCGLTPKTGRCAILFPHGVLFGDAEEEMRRKARRRKILLINRRSSASTFSTLPKTPSRTHCWNRRWQVRYRGKRSGMSSRRATLLRTQKTPLMTSRLSFQGLQRPSSRRGGSGISGGMIAHCSSANSSRRAIYLA